jgi:hypothetical protein
MGGINGVVVHVYGEQQIRDLLVQGGQHLERGREDLAAGWIDIEKSRHEMNLPIVGSLFGDRDYAKGLQELAAGRRELAEAREDFVEAGQDPAWIEQQIKQQELFASLWSAVSFL